MNRMIFWYANLMIFLALCIATITVANAAQKQDRPLIKVRKQDKVTQFESLECKQLTIRSGDGKNTIVLTSWEDGVGVYVMGTDNQGVKLISQTGSAPFIGIHDGQADECNLSLYLSGGDPIARILIKGKAHSVNLKLLAR